MITSDQIFDNIWKDLARATVDRKHDFKRAVLATSSIGLIKQRVVVLRKVIDRDAIVFYTDARSQKVKDIAVTPEVQVLFYDNRKRTQLSCRGTSVLIRSNIDFKSWDQKKLKDYTTVLSPGTEVGWEDQIQYDFKSVYFQQIKIELQSIEYLQLSRDQHMRILYSRKEDQWDSVRLVP